VVVFSISWIPLEFCIGLRLCEVNCPDSNE